MCDTFAALPDATLDGVVIFGKNSDRPNGEVQDVVCLPATDHLAGTKLRCTWIEIPQAAHTHAVILSRPRWMWGAEMGANEHGVVIGNEAVWTNQPLAETGLLGMDLLRLGLERGSTAHEALHVITDLMAEYGQGGSCAEHFNWSYHNAYLLADPVEAWVLETAGEYWVAERLRSSARSISNGLTIHGAGELRHPRLESLVGKAGPGEFDFAFHFSGQPAGQPPSSHSRAGRVASLLNENLGSITCETAKTILRDHAGGVCMHGDFETRGSQVSVLGPGAQEHWFIEEAFPCRQSFRGYSF